MDDTDGSGRLVPEGLRAAVIGASGIGKHHAKWIAALGGEVAAIVGSSSVTAAATAQALHDQLGLSPRPYHDVREMLAAEDPDLVHVCTPPHLHHAHVMALAPHRCHLMCEKPLTWDDTKSAAELLAEAREMVAATARPDRITAVNLQYTAVPPAYYALCGRLGQPPGQPRSFFMRMDSKREENVYDIIWRELSPHCLSVMTAFCGPGHIAAGSISLILAERENRAEFVYHGADGQVCDCEIVVAATLAGPLNRRFGINGIIADYEGRNDDQGVFRTVLRLGDTEAVSDDFMYLSMRELLWAVSGQAPRPLATLAEGLHNEEMQLSILARGRRV
jgi:predicted dehydrogenase